MLKPRRPINPAESGPVTLKHLGIIVALLPEAACFTRYTVVDQPIRINDKVSLIISGMGQDRAARAARQLIGEGIDGLVCVGTAGALTADLAPGDLLIPENVLSSDNQAFAVSREWHMHALTCFADFPGPVHTGCLLSGDEIISQTAGKQQLADTSGTIAVDTESAAALNLAALHGLPCLVIRSIVDPAAFAIPRFILENTDPYGKPDVLSMIKSIVPELQRIVPLIQLGWYFRKAGNSLKGICRRINKLAEYVPGA